MEKNHPCTISLIQIIGKTGEIEAEIKDTKFNTYFSDKNLSTDNDKKVII
jgi:hypothetical protein